MAKKTIFTFYVLAVCLICVTVSTVMVSIIMHSLIGMSFPAHTIDSYTYQQHTTDEIFLEKLKDEDPCTYRERVTACKPIPSMEKVGELLTKSWNQALDKEKHEHTKTLTETFPYLILFLLVGLFHLRLYKNIKD